MAPVLLLTTQQAQHNKQVFERVTAKLPRPPSSEVSVLHLSFDGIANNVSVAHQISSAPYPPLPGSSIFSDPTLHVHALATFFSTAMSTVGYVPNSPVTPPFEQAWLFIRLLQELMWYAPFLPLVRSFEDHYENSSLDCTPLLNAVTRFMDKVVETMGAANASQVSSDLTKMVVSAVESMGSSSSERAEKTLFSVFKIDGKSINFPYPVGTILWSSVVVERHTSGSGKSTTVQEHQKIEMMSYGYMIQSPVVVAHAAELSKAFGVSSEQFVGSINGLINV